MKSFRIRSLLWQGPAVLFGSLLLGGGVRAWRDPLMRPPRLPNRRPHGVVLPAVGASWLVATAASRRFCHRQRTSPQAATSTQMATNCLTTGLLLNGVKLGLAAPGVAWCVFECARRWIASRPSTPADVVIVLGCALVGDRPSDILERRLHRALRVIHATGSARAFSDGCADTAARAAGNVIVVTCGGVGGDAEYSEDAIDPTTLPDRPPLAEADVMAEWLVDRGVADENIVREVTSTSTTENMEHALEMLSGQLEGKTVTVVTSDFHVPRVRKVIRDRDFAARTGSKAWRVEGARTPGKYWASSILREFFAIIALRVVDSWKRRK